MRTRKHHNNKGTAQVRNGNSSRRLERLAHRLNVPFIAHNVGGTEHDGDEPIAVIGVEIDLIKNSLRFLTDEML